MFFSAPLGEQPLSELIATPGNGDNFDIGKFFFEVRQHRFIATDVNRDLAFFLGGFESFLPFLLPRGLGLSGSGS